MENPMPDPSYKKRWGWGRFRPDCLQCFCKPEWALFFICCAVFTQGFIINGFLHIVLPAIEKRFNLKSREAGIICGSYDISSVTLLVPVTYFGGHPRARRPLWYGSGMLILGIGCLIFSVPELIASSTDAAEESKPSLICDMNFISNVEVCENKKIRLSPVFWIFLFSSLLCGSGGCILYTLAVTYIDDSVTKARSAVFLGLFYLSVTLGTATGFVSGGYILQLPSNFLYVKIRKLTGTEGQISQTLNPENESFHGAWWVGFLLSGIVFLTLSIPNLGFPAELPNASQIRESKRMESDIRSGSFIAGENINIKNIPRAVLNVLKNPTFVFMSFGACLESMVVNGASTFLPKILENQFYLNTKTSAKIIGSIALLGGVVGILAGGLIIKHFNLDCKRILKLCIFFCCMSCSCFPVILLYCPIKKFAGLSVSYRSSVDKFTAPCNSKCNCHEENYFPVCGADGINHYSPCFAGCAAVKEKSSGVNEYYNCSCIKVNELSSKPEATGKTCSRFCPLVFIFVPILAICLLCMFSNVVPGITVILRCVDSTQRSLALGIQWLMIRTCGIFALSTIGGNIDKSCLHWEKKCAEQGSCVLYDNQDFSMRLFFLSGIAKVLALTCITIAMLAYKPVEQRSLRNERQLRHIEE